MFSKYLAGWWLSHPSEKYESQLGWFFPIYGKIKNVPNHLPDVFKVSRNISPWNPSVTARLWTLRCVIFQAPFLWLAGRNDLPRWIPKWVATLVPYFWPYVGKIFLYIGLKNRPYIWYLQFRFLKGPLNCGPTGIVHCKPSILGYSTSTPPTSGNM